MERRDAMTVQVPTFINESAEAEWWASEEGRAFLKLQSSEARTKALGGAKLVVALAKGN